MFKVITNCLGISPFLYYDLTWREIDLMMQGYFEKKEKEIERQKELIELQAIAFQTGYVNARNGTEYKVFNDQNDKTNEIDPEVKNNDLNYLKNLFS